MKESKNWPMKKRALIIDGNNRAHAAYHAYDRLSYKGQSVSMIYGLPSMIKGLLREYSPKMVLMVWDGERSKHRLKLYPEYKGKRNSRSLMDYDDFLKQKKITQQALYYLGVRQVLNPEVEADDMIYKLTRVLIKQGYEDIIIVSGDKDFNQLIGRFISVYSETKKQIIGLYDCVRVFGYHPHQCIDYLTLVGDTSDNINGYPGIGEKRASDFIRDFGSISSFISQKHKHNIIDPKKLLALKERNHILIDLRGYYEEYKDEIKVKFIKDNPKPEINRSKFLALSGKFGMRKFMSSQFIKPFKVLRYGKKGSN